MIFSCQGPLARSRRILRLKTLLSAQGWRGRMGQQGQPSNWGNISQQSLSGFKVKELYKTVINIVVLISMIFWIKRLGNTMECLLLNEECRQQKHYLHCNWMYWEKHQVHIVADQSRITSLLYLPSKLNLSYVWCECDVRKSNTPQYLSNMKSDLHEFFSEWKYWSPKMIKIVCGPGV